MAKRRRSPGRPALARVSIASLQAEIQRRTSRASGLLKKRDRLLKRLAAVTVKLEAAGIESDAPVRVGARGATARGARGPRRRPRNEMNLVEALAQLLKGKTMSVTDAAEAVQRAGYKSSSANFRLIVNQALLKSPKFKKVSRGQYTAKG